MSAPAWAAPGGRIVGMIRDPSGAPVISAKVTVTSLSRAETREAVPDSTGDFDLRELAPGVWSLAVDAPGFKRSLISDVTVEVDRATRADVVLELGTRSETIEVAAKSPVMDQDLSTRAAVADRAMIVSLPLNGRQYLDLAALTPGIVPAAPGTQGNGFNSVGIRSQSNVYLLDGVSNMDTQTNQPLNLFRITEAVEEFSVQTGPAPAEFGRGAGAQVNVVTRSGGNDIHGSAFEYLRNTDLTAADFFTNKLGGPKNALNRNQFGAAAGGPLRRNRTFWFASYEGFRQSAPLVSSVLVPSLAQRATVTDPISQKLLAYFPLPNTAGTLNYIANVHSRDTDDTGLLRVDHRLSDRDRLSARWTEYWGYSDAPGPTPLTGGNHGPVSQVSAMLDEEHSFSPRWLNELRLGYSRFGMTRTVQDAGLNAAGIFTDAGGAPLPGVVNAAQNPLNSGLPSIAISGGFAALGTNANFPQGRVANTTELFDNVSDIAPWGAARHVFRWGVHLRREDSSRYLNRSERGSVNFASFADFAKGQIMTATFRTGSTQAYWRRYPWDLYWQDEFRVRDNLTLEYGLRYEYPSAVAELRSNATNFVPGYGPMIDGTSSVVDIDPTRTGAASLIYRTAPFTLPRSGVYSDRNNVAPMFGFAWSPSALGRGEQTTVIRGGVRIAYDDLFNNVPAGMALAAPYNLQTAQTANVTQPGKFAWPLAFNQNVPLVSNVGSQGPGTPTVGILTFQGVDPNLRSAYAWIYDLAIQRRISRKIVLEATWQGSSGHRLGMFVDVNQPFVIVRDPSKRGPVAPNEQLFPYSHFGQSQIAKSIGNSNYNGLVATISRHSRRSEVRVAYTLGKSLDYNSSYFGSGNLPGEPGAPIDARNLRLDHGPSAFDIRHRLVGLYRFDLPAGFRISGIVTLQSGTPFTVVTGNPDTSGFNQATAGTSPDGGNRPNLVKPGALPQNNRQPDAAFDTSWFAANLAGQDGSSGRNQYYGPGLLNFDLSAVKRFRPLKKWRENAGFELRGDFFNLLNHTNFANPISDMSNASFGKITQTLGSAVGTSAGTSGGVAGGPRVIQVALRLEF